MSTTLLSGLRHQVKGRAVHRRTVVADEVAAGVAKGVAAPGPTTRGIKGGLITLWMLLGSLVIFFLPWEKKSSSCFALDEGSARCHFRSELCCWPALSLCYGLCIHFLRIDDGCMWYRERYSPALWSVFIVVRSLRSCRYSGHGMILTWASGFDDLFLLTNSVWISQNCSRIEVFSRNCVICMHSLPTFLYGVVYLD